MQGSLWKGLLTTGIVLCVAAGVLFVAERFGIKKLPGDVVFRSGNMTIAFPIVTCIVLSILLSLVFRLFR